jgi:hypothetical protein
MVVLLGLLGGGEMSQNEWYCRIDGEVVGPVTFRALKTMAAVGEVVATDEIRSGPEGFWQPAKSVEGLLFAATVRKEKLSGLEERPRSRAGTIYKMVQVPPEIILTKANQKGDEAAAYLEELVNRYASQGWEFYRIGTFVVSTRPGCLGFLSGVNEESVQRYVVTFRKQGP